VETKNDVTCTLDLVAVL